MGWSPQETGKHQDHVIAHVVGATVLGFFVAGEAAHVLLDIGFIWTIYLDGEMGLVPQSVAVDELDVDETVKAELLSDASLLHNEGHGASDLKRFIASPAPCLIGEVSFYADAERRRILMTGEEESLAIETSLATGEISFHAVSLTDV
ncbi:MAG: hypothetical protein WCF57_21350 [Pyrinomonadaceae bacterium]